MTKERAIAICLEMGDNEDGAMGIISTIEEHAGLAGMTEAEFRAICEDTYDR